MPVVPGAGMSRGSSSGTRKAPRCSACKKRIPAHEPDVLLREIDGSPGRSPGRTRFYHERCTSAAVELVLRAELPAAWHMSVRHVEWAAN